jgi:hypothetical protein
MIGLFLLPPLLNGPIYKVFLERILPSLLEDVPLIVSRQMWIQHDGAPAHFSNVSRDYLDVAFHGRWIGRGGPVTWPPRSPELTPLVYFVWCHLKSLIYDTPVDNEFELLATIQYLLHMTWSVRHLEYLKGCAKVSFGDVKHAFIIVPPDLPLLPQMKLVIVI